MNSYSTDTTPLAPVPNIANRENLNMMRQTAADWTVFNTQIQEGGQSAAEYMTGGSMNPRP